ncbi:chromosome partitioning protein ParA [Xanthomarina sp. F2636L]|uniref:chromosome partitioning protein ParA n=1 Tax=Xanthomarina sp. F2636L TaxID=2996018 RepID=UPI00225E5DE9|nr:chromosome partitioning protein ParA [Xanthomarina sp. F2636L]MCX7549780.1 chromosome partitioning protein ParA [Xanthomarina sp. F2636L]
MENNTNNNMGLKVALGIALVLFLGAAFYSFDLLKDKKETEAQLTEEKQLVMKDLSNMAKQYDIVIGDNEIANKNLVEAKARIQGLMDSLQISETNVKSLWRYKSKYLSLQKEMDILLTENDKLKIENSLLATSLDSTRVRLEERTMFTDSLMVQNTALADVVENAAVLSTVGLKGFGVIERSSGKLVPTERAGRSDKIRVCFTVAKNALVQSGEQELYVQVIDPKNNTLGVNEQVQFEEKTLNYSIVSKFNYENANLNICEFVSPGKDGFEKGRYTVNVFNEKDLVSTSEFTLK